MSRINASGFASDLLAFVVAHSTDSRSIAGYAGKVMREMVLKFQDPPCRIVPAGLCAPLLMPLSHDMPLYRAMFPRYDRLPPFVARLVRQRRGSLHMIDVGANIGDTIASICPGAEDRCIALEPHPMFFRYLLENMAGTGSVECIQLACSEDVGQLGFKSQTRGTSSPGAYINGGASSASQPLDMIWQREWHGGRVDFLKIDTDGFDATVVRGSTELLSAWQPWLYYECDVRLTPGGATELLDVPRRLHDCGYREALAFDNFGNFAMRLTLNDPPGWSKLMSGQRKDGAVVYHDILVIPPGEDASLFFSHYLPREQAWRDDRFALDARHQ